MGVLGTGRNEAWLYMAGGKVPIAPIETPTNLEWNRVLNDVSDAVVDVATGQHGDCCSIYGKLGTWGHEIVMFRDGKRVWEGPITNIKWRRGGVSLLAQDPLAWTKKRLTSAKSVPAPDYAEKQLWEEITLALGTSGTHDPNVLPYAQRLAANTGPLITRDVKTFGGMYYDQFLELTKGGGMFTFVGRKMLVWHSGYVMGKTATLLPTSHMSGEVEVEEDGMEVGQRVAFVNDKGAVGTSPLPTVHAFYGLNDLLVSSDAPDAATLAVMAATFQKEHMPAPLRVNIPQGSVLSCDAPFSMEELVAGTLMPTKIEDGICKTVISTHQLTGVKVTQNAAGEQVAITLDSASGRVLP
jgi:hypothetical protein